MKNKYRTEVYGIYYINIEHYNFETIRVFDMKLMGEF